MKRPSRNAIVYVLVGAIALFVASQWLGSGDEPTELTLSEFREHVAEGEVATATIKDRSNKITGELRTDEEDEVAYPQEFADELAAELGDAEPPIDVEVDQQEQSLWATLLINLLPFVLLIGVFLFVMNSMQGGGSRVMQFGKAKAKQVSKDEPKVTFADVAGCDEAVEELQEIKEFLQNPARFQAIGAKIPKGVLLYGPPGTGKTLLARAVAGEAGVPFFSISGSEFVEMFVGVGAARVRDLFDQARQAAPSIIFIDELDALGRARGSGFLGGPDEKEQTLNQLLSELDGFDPSTGIVLLAATNRPEILDPALLRAGRFDRQVLVDRPDRKGRVQILQVHVRKVTLAPDVVLDDVAALTPGFSGADLANLVNEAALLATRRGAEAVSATDFTSAVERIVAGIEKRSRAMNAEERRAVACHEMGHALVAGALPDMDPVQKVSIIPRGVGALGYTIQRPTEDRFLMSRRNLEHKMTVLMGGRAAEDLVLGEISTGAADDLDKATEIARHMAMRYGMVREIGQVVYDEPHSPFLGDGLATRPVQREHSEATAREIDLAVRALVEAAYMQARSLLDARRALLERGIALLLEKETLTADEFPFRDGA
mgnify:CR=1 FL=1